MRRILVLADLEANKLGSMEEFAMFLSRELAARGDICFLGFIAEPVPSVRRMLEDSGARIADIPRYGNGTLPWQNGSVLLRALALHRFIRKERIDLVHINFYSLTDPYLLGVYCSEARIVFTEHTSGAVPCREGGKKFLSRAVHGVLTRRIARYVAVSDFVRERLKVSHHAEGRKVITIYNGVNLERFGVRDRLLARQQTNLPVDGKIILAVAMLIPEKGLHCLVEAVALLKRKHVGGKLTLVIVGEGACRSELEMMAHELGVADSVSFLGRRSDVDELVAAADQVAVPSIWQEAFGFIIAEAMAAGRPVVASRVGGIPELIEHRETGLLAEPGNVRELADRIGELISDDELGEGLAANAQERARREFNLEHQTARYVDLYYEVLGYGEV